MLRMMGTIRETHDVGEVTKQGNETQILLPLYIINPIEKLVKRNGWEILGFCTLARSSARLYFPQFNHGGCRC